MATSASTIAAPSPLKMGGDIAADWERFRSEWKNYEIAADLTDVPDKKRMQPFFLRASVRLPMEYFASSSSSARMTDRT